MSKRVTEAKKVYDELKQVERYMFAHNKVNTCLPKKKAKIQEAVLSRLGVKKMNCNFKLTELVRKMSLDEGTEFNRYVRF